jgi:hypothetical protein
MSTNKEYSRKPIEIIIIFYLFTFKLGLSHTFLTFLFLGVLIEE